MVCEHDTVFPYPFIFVPVKEKRKGMILFKESALIIFNLKGGKRNNCCTSILFILNST